MNGCNINSCERYARGDVGGCLCCGRLYALVYASIRFGINLGTVVYRKYSQTPLKDALLKSTPRYKDEKKI